MKKVRRRHPPTDLLTSLIIKGNKRGEEAFLDTGITRNKKRKRVKKQKNRQEKKEEEPKMLVAKIVAADDSSNKRGVEEIDENQLVSNKKVKTFDDTCGGVSQPDVIRKKNKKKRDMKRKNRQEKMVVVEKPAKESSCLASYDKEVDLNEPVAVETKIVSATKDGLSGESESKDSPDEEVENRAVDPAPVKKKGLFDDWEGYCSLSKENRHKLLLFLAREYDLNRTQVRDLMKQYVGLEIPRGDVTDEHGHEKEGQLSAFYRIERNLRYALNPMYSFLFERLNTHPGGLKFLATVRADILSIIASKEDKLKELTCFEGRTCASHYYPKCPQPELTVGLTSHTDPVVLTILVQNEVGGLLQVKCGEDWADVEAVPGAIVINIGDLLKVKCGEDWADVEAVPGVIVINIGDLL